jgi:zona occludens toxin (predicted ATPase)
MQPPSATTEQSAALEHPLADARSAAMAHNSVLSLGQYAVAWAQP